MSASADYVMTQATRLVQHSERTQSLLRTILEWTDAGNYDPVADIHSLRLPGVTIRAIQRLLDPE